MRIVIHAGMHKTGSSAIQYHFFRNAYPGLRYVRWENPNHSDLFVLLFEDPDRLASHYGFKPRGPAFCAQLPQMRRQWLASLTEDLDAGRAETVVLSGEEISGPAFGDAVARMAEFLRRWTDDITVVAYVRSPLSYAASAFQQRLKGGTLAAFNLDGLWPHYRARFARLDDCFGQDRVLLSPYDRRTLFGGDVTRDFAARLGIDPADVAPAEVNATLSAEATALLFAQRRLGDGFVAGFSGAHAANQGFINVLRQIGSGRLRLADAAWAPVLEKNHDDLAWIERRLGAPLQDRPDPDAIAIRSEDDLIRLAVDSYPALEQVLLRSIRRSRRPPLQRTVRALDLLRKLSY